MVNVVLPLPDRAYKLMVNAVYHYNNYYKKIEIKTNTVIVILTLPDIPYKYTINVVLPSPDIPYKYTIKGCFTITRYSLKIHCQRCF